MTPYFVRFSGLYVYIINITSYIRHIFITYKLTNIVVVIDIYILDSTELLWRYPAKQAGTHVE